MTVRLLVPYGKYPKNSNLTTGAATEAELLRTGQADKNTSAGTTYADPVPTERSGPPAVETTGGVDTLRADGRDLLNLTAAQSLVSGYGNLDQDKLSQLFGDDEMIIGTYANRPVATSVASGKEFMASDLSNARWVSDGTQWILLTPCSLLKTATASSIVDSVGQATTESTLATLNIPAGALGANDGLQLDLIWSCTNTAAAKRIRARFGGTVLFNVDLTTHLVFRQSVKLRNRNSQASQISQGNSTTNFGPIGSVGAQTFTVDFAAAQALTITGQFPVTGASANTLTLEEATITAL